MGLVKRLNKLLKTTAMLAICLSMILSVVPSAHATSGPNITPFITTNGPASGSGSGTAVNYMTNDPSGNTWQATSTGVYELVKGTTAWKQVYSNVSVVDMQWNNGTMYLLDGNNLCQGGTTSATVIRSNVNEFTFDGNGNIWTAETSYIIYEYTGGIWVNRGTISGSVTGNPIGGHAMRFDGQYIYLNTAWSGTYYVCYFTPVTSGTISVNKVTYSYGSSSYVQICVGTFRLDSKNHLYMTDGNSSSDPVIYQISGGIATQILGDPADASSYYTITDVTFDQNDNPIVITENNFLSRYNISKQVWSNIGTTGPTNASPSGRYIVADKSSGIVCVEESDLTMYQSILPNYSSAYGWNALQTITQTNEKIVGYDPTTKYAIGFEENGSLAYDVIDMSQPSTPIVKALGSGLGGFVGVTNGKLLFNTGSTGFYSIDEVTGAQTTPSHSGYSVYSSQEDAAGNIYCVISTGGASPSFYTVMFDNKTLNMTTLQGPIAQFPWIPVPFTDGAGTWLVNTYLYEIYNTATGKMYSGLNNNTGSTSGIMPNYGSSVAFGFPTFASKDLITGINSNGVRWQLTSAGDISSTIFFTKSYSQATGLYPLADGSYALRGSDNSNDLYILPDINNPSSVYDTGWNWNYNVPASTRTSAMNFSLGNQNSNIFSQVFMNDIYFFGSQSWGTGTPMGYALGSGQVGTPILTSSSGTQTSITVKASTTTGTYGYTYNYQLMSGATVVASASNQGPSYIFTGLSAGTSYTLNVQVTNVFGTISSWTNLGVISTVPPTPATPTVTITGSGWESSGGNDTLNVSFTAVTGATGYNVVLLDGATVLKTFDIGNTTSNATVTVPDQTHATGFLDSTGKYQVAVQAYNISGGQKQATPASTPVPLSPVNQTDTTAPTWANNNPIMLNNGQDYTSVQTIPIAINATEAESGISKVLVSNDNMFWTTFNFGTASQGVTNISNYTITNSWKLPAGQGQKTIYIKLVDLVGNTSDLATGFEGLQVNSTPPTVSLAINGGQPQTTNQSVALTITAADPAYPNNQLTMSFSSDGQNWSSPVAFQSTYNWTLPSSTSGSYPVFVRVTDPVANTGLSYSQIYYLNQATTPVVGGTGTTTAGGTAGVTFTQNGASSTATTITYNGYSNVYVVPTPQISLDFSGSGASYVSVSSDYISFSKLYSTASPFGIYLPSGDGFKTVWAQLANANDPNALGSAGKLYFLVDGTAPTVSLSGVNNASATSGTTFNVQIDATDNLSSLTQMQYQINGGVWQNIPANGQIAITGFTQHSGYKTYTITVKDASGNKTSKKISFTSL